KWCAGMMGLGYEKHVGPCLVAVNETALPGDADFFLETAGKQYGFQLVEAMEAGRKRGAEYKGFANVTVRAIPYAPERGRTEGPAWIADKVRQKAEKNYADAAALNLLVYLNFSAHQIEHRDVVSAARPWCNRFASV